jgi:sugar (pentulose or hexulose) kinase
MSSISSTCRKVKYLLPEIVDGATTHHALSDEAAGLTGLKAGTPVVLGYVDVVCTSIGAGLYEPGTDTGCSIIGSTGMHMRFAKERRDVLAQQGPDRLHDVPADTGPMRRCSPTWPPRSISTGSSVSPVAC